MRRTQQKLFKRKNIIWTFAVLAIGSGGVVGLLLSMLDPLNVILGILGMLGILGIFLEPEWGLAIFVFMAYTNFSGVMIKYHGIPSIAKVFTTVLTLAIITRSLRNKKLPTGWTHAAILVAGYGIIGCVTLLYAVDFTSAQNALSTYVKEAFLILILVALIQKPTSLRQAIWALILAGIFLGTINTFQFLTKTFENNYWGFGQATIKHIAEKTNDYRISGPIGDPNFFAQLMLVLIPLAFGRLWNEFSRFLRFLAAWALIVCVLVVIFTFSRGGLVALVVMFAVMLLFRRPPLRVLIISLLIGSFLLLLIPATYIQRLQSLIEVLPTEEEESQKDGAIRGRVSEMIVSWRIFRDHPILGVGWQNSRRYYQAYSRDLGLDRRREDRPAHNIFLKIGADSGLLGLTMFMIILVEVFRSLRFAYRIFTVSELLEYANLSVSFGIGLIGFLTAALFLPDSYPRFLWLLLGIALTMPNVARYIQRNAINTRVIAQ